MIAMRLDDLELMEAWQERDPSLRWNVVFPLMETPGTESLGVVYFELEAGEALATHTDSRDEIVVLLSGSGEGTVGDESAPLSAGGLIFIPAMASHGFRNTGPATVRAVGIFAGATVTSTFEEPVMPVGERVFGRPADVE